MPTLEELKEQGNTAFKARKYQEALSSYRQMLLEQSPDNSKLQKVALSNSGMALKKLERWDEALSFYKRLLLLEPDHQKALYHTADILFFQKNYQDAYEAIFQLLKLYPNNEQAQALEEKCRSFVEAKVCCIAIDLKVTPEGAVKILEIGDAERSSQGRLRKLRGEKRIVDSLFLCDYPKGVLSGALSRSCLGQFNAEGNGVAEDLQTLPDVLVEDPRDLSQFPNLILGLSDENFPEKTFRTKGVIPLGNDIMALLACEDKRLFHETWVKFGDPTLRPQTVIFPKKEGFSEAAELASDGRTIVLKAPDLCASEGIFFAKEKDLAPISQRQKITYGLLIQEIGKTLPSHLGLLEKAQRMFAHPERHLYMSNSPYVLAEEYIDSKSVEKDGKNYDATMRVWVSVLRDKGQVRVSPFVAVWQLPKEPCGVEKTKDTNISEIRLDGQPGNAKEVSPEEFLQVKTILSKELTPYFETLFETSYQDWIASYFSDLQDTARYHHGLFLSLKAVSLLAELGCYAEGHAMLQQYRSHFRKEECPEVLRRKHIFLRGLLFFYEEKYAEALSEFKRAEKLDTYHKPDALPALYKAKTLFEQGHFQKSMETVEKLSLVAAENQIKDRLLFLRERILQQQNSQRLQQKGHRR